MKSIVELVKNAFGELKPSAGWAIIQRAAKRYEKEQGSDSERASKAAAQAAMEIFESTYIGDKVKEKELYQERRSELESKLADALEKAAIAALKGL